jgi:intein-encoded DNA endonuclease-like protein
MINTIKIIELFNKNIPFHEIAKSCNTSSATISRFLTKQKLNRKNILRKCDHENVINFYKNGKSTNEISKLIGITHQSVCYILKSNKIKIRKINHNEIADKFRKYHIDFSIFENLNEIGAYYLGIFYADGSVSNNKNHRTSQFSITLKDTDEHILLDLIHDLKSNCVLYNGGCSINNKTFKNKRLVISNYKFINILKKFGMDSNNNYKKHVPRLNNKFYSHFVRGFLDGDGYITKHHHKSRDKKRRYGHIATGFAITYKSFGIDLIKLINKFTAVNGKLYKMKSIWAIRYTHNKAKKILQWIYDNPIRKLNRKHEKWIELKNIINIYK